MKRTLRVMVSIILMVALSTAMTFAGTGGTKVSETNSVKTIPSTSVKADSRVVDAFVDLGFKVKYDKNMANGAGVFSVAKHAVILKYKNEENTLHEMGHFVSRLQKGADETAEFVKIFNTEKKKYNGKLKSYIKGSNKEYFAQSFAEYTTNPSKLKKADRKPMLM